MKFSFPLKRNKKEHKATRPNYVNLRPRIDNSNILAQAKKRKKTNTYNVRKLALPENLANLPIKKVLVVIIVLVSLLAFFFFLKNTTIFNVKEVVVITDKQEDYSVVKSIADEYLSENIIFISSSEIEKKIKDRFNSIHTVFVDKSLSGKLKIEVIEDIPIYYEANNTGIYLINQRGEIMEIVQPRDKLQFDETEQLLRENKLPADSDQVRIKYLSKFEEADRSKVVWKDLPKEDKESTLTQMKDELASKINDFSNKLSDQLKEDAFKNLIGSYIPNNRTYKVGESVSLDSLNFVSIVLDFFKSKNLVSSKVVWDSAYSLEVFLQDNPKVLFSVKRNYSSQFSDLNTLIYHGQFNGAKIVDVRSSNYSVVR